VKIKKISRVQYSGTVYNFETFPDHNYFAEGILVHNCYKSNIAKGENMNLLTFKKVFEKLPSSICQIAFGIGSLDSNPDLFEILSYTKSKGIIPNITISGTGLKQKHVTELSKHCGAVAVSNYNKDVCYNSVEKLSETKLQCNIHQLLSEETYPQCLSLIEDTKTDKRLKKLNSIVFLSLKRMGRGKNYTPVTDMKKFKALFSNLTKVGFDSCSAPLVFKAMEKAPNFRQIKAMIEPCESLLFSGYISVDAKFYPCSFLEKIGDWEEGIDILKTENFTADVWNSPKAKAWRDKLLVNKCKCKLKPICRTCPQYKELSCG